LWWKPVGNAKSYVIESSTDPATITSWEHAGIATSATKTITNLKSGTRFWFRVAAVAAAGQSGIGGHLKIGNRVQVAGGAKVFTDLPDDAKVMGSPAVPFQDFARAHAVVKRLARKKNQ